VTKVEKMRCHVVRKMAVALQVSYLVLSAEFAVVALLRGGHMLEK
jgi:hypothetical protein